MDTRGKSISVLTIFIMVALALVVPGLSSAGSLEPSDPPGPTMKTLDQIPPTWSQRLPASERFQGVFEYEDVCYIGGHPYPCTKYYAVLDKETGLVWQKDLRSPFTYSNWDDSQNYCNRLYLGGRMGWRLPTVQELASLLDPTQVDLTQFIPALPSGHPFTNVYAQYWTATTFAGDTSHAWFVDINHSPFVFRDGNKSVGLEVWCVRGGQGFDTQ